jgi:hypothetical protein
LQFFVKCLKKLKKYTCCAKKQKSSLQVYYYFIKNLKFFKSKKKMDFSKI